MLIIIVVFFFVFLCFLFFFFHKAIYYNCLALLQLQYIQIEKYISQSYTILIMSDKNKLFLKYAFFA